MAKASLSRSASPSAGGEIPTRAPDLHPLRSDAHGEDPPLRYVAVPAHPRRHRCRDGPACVGQPGRGPDRLARGASGRRWAQRPGPIRCDGTARGPHARPVQRAITRARVRRRRVRGIRPSHLVLELRGRPGVRPDGHGCADTADPARSGPIRRSDRRSATPPPARGARDTSRRCAAGQRPGRDLHRRRLGAGARRRPRLLRRARSEPRRAATRVARVGSARHALGRGGAVAGRSRRGRHPESPGPDCGGLRVLGVPAGMVARRRPVVRRRPGGMVEPPPLARRRAPVHVSGRERVRQAVVAARDDHLRVRCGRMRGLHVARRRRLAARPARPGRRDDRDPRALDEHRLARRRRLHRRVHRRCAGPERRGGEPRPRIGRDTGAPHVERTLDRRAHPVPPGRARLAYRRRR